MNIKSKYIIAALAGIVVVLLIIIAFLLGRGSVSQGNNSFLNNPSEVLSFSSEDEIVNFIGEPKNLDISMSAGTVTFVSGSQFNVEYDASVINVSSSGDTLKILNVHSRPSNSERKKMNVVITVPDEYSFSSVDVELGAGKLTAYSLSAGSLSMELGAGSAEFDNISVSSSANIKEGAGELIINSGEISNLNLKCGAGETRISAVLKGKSSVAAGFGEVNMSLIGAEEDYSVSFGVGLGACFFNNSKLSANGTYGNGENSVQIAGGMGVIHVNIVN
ncbi:MAG: DUF4097 family beta strand repeat protein [Oscillospiraceae bacterium]|nr:DUF4097 family beta strand repeat protein [Oscillospiraceae bacterium]